MSGWIYISDAQAKTKKIKPTENEYRSGNLRVDRMIILVLESGRAYLSYRASSMHHQVKYPDGNYAPWLRIQLLDEDGEPTGGIVNVDIATVNECGGYEFHNNINITSKFGEFEFEDATSFSVQFSGLREKKC